MNEWTVKKWLLVLAALLLSGFAVYASVTGPEARYTGAPGDINSCVQCHDTYEQANVGPGSVRIEGNPPVYEPGQAYTLAVTVQQSARPRFGFQLTAIDRDGNRAGSLTPLGSDTQINPQTGTGDRQYVQHTQAGTFPSTPGSRVWQIRWTAPSTDIGTVRFYVAGNAANGNGTNQQDYIYTNSALSESSSTVVSLSLLSNPEGQTLEAGTKYNINWAVTNSSNVDSIELRYSTDDGATFPITNLIVSSADSSLTSYEWTVPNTPTPQARLRVQVATKSGTAVDAKSGRFTIAGSSTGPRPSIGNAYVDGKALLVNGEGFQMGAWVEVNGDRQKTKNLEDFSHQLKCKKAGKWIPPGTPVSLVVKNPDGTASDPFTFVRPAG